MNIVRLSSKMKGFVRFIFVAFLIVESVSGLKSPYPKPVQRPIVEDVGEPLYLTPLIKKGNIKEARELARVKNLTDVVSFSGYFTVNESYNSNIFFWFFPSAFNPETSPVLIWLQGGPGGSSLFGLFAENGPFIIHQDESISLRKYAWTLTHSVIYIDNPVGTGYSFTRDENGFVTNEKEVGRDLYSVLTQFFQLFPEFKSRDFFVTGESYAGKYIPAIAYKIHEENRKHPENKINMKGVAIGDGFCDPPNMLNYGEFLYNVGLIDKNQQKYFQQEEQKARDLISQEKFADASDVIDKLLDGDFSGNSFFTNSTGMHFYFNYLMPTAPPEQNYYSSFVQKEHVRRSIHVGNITYADLGSKVEIHLKNDMYRTAVPNIVALLDAEEKYKLMFYNGQLDIIVASILTDNFLNKMKWHGSDNFATADRKLYYVGKDLAGYVKVADNLIWLIVRDAGHILPYDQPQWSFDIINRFTSGKEFA